MADDKDAAEAAAADAKVEAEVDYEKFRADLERLKGDVLTLRDSLSAYGAAKFTSARATAEAQLGELQAEMERLATELRIQGREATARLERRVHERPFQSLLIAAGFGFVLSHLLRRR